MIPYTQTYKQMSPLYNISIDKDVDDDTNKYNKFSLPDSYQKVNWTPTTANTAEHTPSSVMTVETASQPPAP